MYKLSSLVLTICVYIVYSQTNLTQFELEEQKRINDSLFEIFHGCVCIPYFSCSYANNYMFAVRLNLIPKEKMCSDPNYVCCREVRDTVYNSIATETPPESTTQKVKERTMDNMYTCGMAKTDIGVRILNSDMESETTIAGEIPWMVEIFQQPTSSKQPPQFICPGTLIHPKVVLTAVHSLGSAVNNTETLKVVATGKEYFQNLGVNPEDERNVTKVITHSRYYKRWLYNDMALLILDKEYSFGANYLNPICLPKLNQNFDGKRCIATGWGKNVSGNNPPLHKVDVPILSHKECQKLLRKTHLGVNFHLHSSFLCAGGEEGKDTCYGDGGGPLMCLGDDYSYVQVGIVSWGITEKCGVSGKPGVYVDVSKFSKAIKNKLLAEGISIN